MGQVISKRAMQMAIDKAKKYGMGMVAVRNSCHYGIAGYYVNQANEQGCIGITGTNARPSVAPTFGVDGMLGTNPLTIGIPTDEKFDFTIDCATSIIQNGRIEYYERIGHDVPSGTIIGKDGNLVEGDAGVALKKIRQGDAALATLGGIGEVLGGYKGYGYAMAIELLSAVLQDGWYGKKLNGKDDEGNNIPYHLGHFFIAIDTNHFLGEELARKKAGDIARSIRNSTKAPGCDRIYTAGEKEYDIWKERENSGVPINEAVQHEINDVRDKLGLDYVFPWEDNYTPYPENYKVKSHIEKL
jgi:LDH2 family malate/lactate/ureidoglycolate dehydrogenase